MKIEKFLVAFAGYFRTFLFCCCVYKHILAVDHSLETFFCF